jgi:hypothetical protein
MPSGENEPVKLVDDGEHGLRSLPTVCSGNVANVTKVDFQEVYEYIIVEALHKANASLGVKIDYTRGEDLKKGGNIVSQVLNHICRAEITITDVTGLNPNVLLEYGIRLSVRDSLNILLRHKGVNLPFDIRDQRCIDYSQDPPGVKRAQENIIGTIEHGLPALRGETDESVDNLFRRNVDLATGRNLERRLTQALMPTPALLADLSNELQRLKHSSPKLRDRTWSLLEKLAQTFLDDPFSRERAIDVYRLLTTLEGFHDKRRDALYKLNEIYAEDPQRKVEAEEYLEKAKALEG